MFHKSILVVFLALAAIAQQAPPSPQKFRITGTVTDSVRGASLPNIEIALFQRGAFLRTTTTDPRGRFAFADLPPGKYGLSALGPGYREQVYEQHGPFGTAIVTGKGLESENLEFRLKPESSISGTVTDEFNEPVQSAEVYLFLSGLGQGEILFQAKYKTSDSGDFYFGSLRDRNYYLVVAAHPWYARHEPDSDEPPSMETGQEEVAKNRAPPTPAEYGHPQLDAAFPTTYYVNATESEQATPIALNPGERAQVEFHLSSVPGLRLKVRENSAVDNAIAPLKLSEQIFGVSRPVTIRRLSPNGTELSGLAPGHYVLEYPPLGSSQPEQQPIDLVTDTEVGRGVASRLAVTVMGAVQLGAEGICQRCKVRLVHLPSYQIYDAQSDSKGFQFDRAVRPGRYYVLVMKQEGYYIKDIAAAGARVQGTNVEIPPGADVRLTIEMTKDLGAITGFAIRDGKPASAVAIHLVPDDPSHHQGLFRGDQSDSDGSFELHDIVPGSYTVIAVAEGWTLDETNPDELKPYLGSGVKVQVRAGITQQIKLAVQARAGTFPANK